MLSARCANIFLLQNALYMRSFSDMTSYIRAYKLFKRYLRLFLAYLFLMSENKQTLAPCLPFDAMCVNERHRIGNVIVYSLIADATK